MVFHLLMSMSSWIQRFQKPKAMGFNGILGPENRSDSQHFKKPQARGFKGILGPEYRKRSVFSKTVV
jgi:hypothetical protein